MDNIQININSSAEIPQSPISCLLPKKMYGKEYAFIALGFKFENADFENVYKATLPIGWTIIDTPTLAFSIYDEKKRLRATGEVSSIFTGMGLERRYNTSEQYDNEKKSFTVSVIDWDKTVLFTSTLPCPVRLTRVPGLGYERTKEYEAIIAEAKAYLATHFPEWEDPTKYWD